jgi:hypothetical protein
MAIELKIILLIIAVILFAAFALVFYFKTRKEVDDVEAGDVRNSILNISRPKRKISFLDRFYINGKRINPRNYHVFRTDGYCMIVRGIFDGYLVFAEKITDPSEYAFSPGDILLIKYEENNKKGHKLREFHKYKNENKSEIQTLYYNLDKTPKFSERGHLTENVIGVVRLFQA